MGDDVTAPEVRVEPSGLTIPVQENESVMDAARRQHYRWPNICDGQALCGTCQVRVLAGGENATAMGPAERTRLRILGRGNDSAARLACQLTVTGPVTVFKRGVKRTARQDPELTERQTR